MTIHPVQLHVERPTQTRRIHVFTRLLLLLALGALGYSSIYWALYLALPAVATLLILQKGGARYLAEDTPRMARVLRWLASAYGYLWLLTDEPPTAEGNAVDLQIVPAGDPTGPSALLRIVYSVPALLLVALLSAVACLFWLVAAVMILLTERMPGFIADFLALTLRVQFRLAAYHMSLVDRYPSLEDSGMAHAAAPREEGGAA